MNKEQLERICRVAGMRPESREKLSGDYDLFLADGFSLPPHRHYWRFGIEPTEFPTGMYVTLWWLSKEGTERLNVGRPMFFELFHNPEFAGPDKKRARLNSARNDAKDFLKKMKKRNGTKH